jgi:hypothetical protein
VWNLAFCFPVLVILLSGWVLVFGPRAGLESKRVLAKWSAGGGRELLLLQEYSCVTEPYSISLFFRKSEQEPWRWYYIDHESTYWWSASLASDGQTVRILRGGDVIANFDVSKGQLVFPDGWRQDGEITVLKEIGE